jgi:hypothetical protein
MRLRVMPRRDTVWFTSQDAPHVSSDESAVGLQVAPSTRMLRRCLAAWALGALLVPRAALADDDEGEREARAFFQPREPWALLSLSGGLGGFPSAQSTNAKGGPTGYGGYGTLAARVDLEAPSPLWVSLVGRTFVGTPAEATFDASVGYNARFYWRDGFGYFAKNRLELRPLIGIKALRAADSTIAPTSVQATAVRFGVDLLVQSSVGVRGVGTLHVHAVGLYDVAREQAGFELEVRDVYPVIRPGSLDGFFLGIGIGYLPSTEGYGQAEIGWEWEMGRAR